MATYIPAKTIEVPRQKLLPPSLNIVGQSRLDRGEGVLSMEVVGLVIDADGVPILGPDGREQYKGTGQRVQLSVAEAMQRTLAGVSGVQVMEFIGALFDQLVEEQGVLQRLQEQAGQ